MWGTIELFLALIAAKIKPAAPSASMWITSMGIPIASWSSSPSNSAVAAAGRRRIPVRAEKVKGSRPDTERLRLDRQSKAKAAGVYKGRKPSIDQAQVAKLRAEGLRATEFAKRTEHWPRVGLSVVGLLEEKRVMERVFTGATRAEATRMADDWWTRQKGLRQTLRTEVAVGQKGPDAQLDQWAITIRYEDESPR
jgi:hypothetical protein